MTMDFEWADLFEDELSDHLPQNTHTERVRVPWPALRDADEKRAELLIENPMDALEVAEDTLSSTGYDASLRVFDLPERRTYRIGKYSSDHLGKLIAVRGEVVDIEAVKPFAEVAAFECSYCRTLNRMSQPGGKLVKPFECQGDGCDNTNQWRLDTDESEIADFQEILLKRANSSMDDPPVEAVYLWDDLCETVSTGDVVTIVGIYDTLPWPDEAVLKTYVDAVSINKSEQPATVDEMADWQVKKWTFETVDELCTAGSDYDCSKREVVETVADEHGVAEGEITAALEDLDDQSVISERRGDRLHITTSSPPTFEPAE